jgi:hypothetical protein
VQRGGPAVAARGDHAVAVAGFAVARGAVNVVALLAAVHDAGVDGEGEAVGDRAVDLAGGHEAVESQLAARHRPRDARPRRHPVGEEVARLEGVVAGLVGHLLAAGGEEQQEKHEDRATYVAVILSGAKDLSVRIPRSFAVSAAQDDGSTTGHR